MAQFLAGNFLLVGCVRDDPGRCVSLWDLSLIPVFYNDEDSVAARTPLWGEAIPELIQYWPPPWVVDNVVYQILPKWVGMMIMALPLASTGLPPDFLSVFEAKHKHIDTTFSSSQGFLAYANIEVVGQIESRPRKTYIVLRIHHRHNHPLFTMQAFAFFCLSICFLRSSTCIHLESCFILPRVYIFVHCRTNSNEMLNCVLLFSN